ncbi:hypothetical protein Q7P35_009300 [Cladosporium inversicolor]
MAMRRSTTDFRLLAYAPVSFSKFAIMTSCDPMLMDSGMFSTQFVDPSAFWKHPVSFQVSNFHLFMQELAFAAANLIDFSLTPYHQDPQSS